MVEVTRCPRCGQVIADGQTTPRCASCGYLMTGAENFAAADALDSATRPAALAAQFATPRFSDADNVDSQTRELPAGAMPPGSGAGAASSDVNGSPQAIWPVASASAADALDAGTRPLPDQGAQPESSAPVKTGFPQAKGAGASDPLLAPTADLPVHPVEPTQTLPPQAASTSSSASPPSTPAASATDSAAMQKRAPWRTLSIAALVLLLLLVGGLGALAAQGKLLPVTATPTATGLKPTATSGIPANFTTYTNANHYRIAYPASWGIGQTNQTTLSLVILSYPPSAANMNIEYFKADTSQDLVRQDDTFLLAFAKPGTALQNKTTPTMATIGGQQWTQEEADVTLSSSSLLAHVVATSTMRGSYAYTIAYLAPATTALGPGAQFTQVNAAYFQPMIRTFAFLG